ncbi:hypothetical protein E2562_025446 [Oryza meyeriana var. granulata]|uniref:Uncharacterized protein n=1 Tax=Oryza meyeriana var. granulata TaxID=110450 RepID=A0A6G1D841_9ORYZ|nr:hypothetical protein E2562_025446 [Oryza meyeriana var. granulata]
MKSDGAQQKHAQAVVPAKRRSVAAGQVRRMVAKVIAQPCGCGMRVITGYSVLVLCPACPWRLPTSPATRCSPAFANITGYSVLSGLSLPLPQKQKYGISPPPSLAGAPPHARSSTRENALFPTLELNDDETMSNRESGDLVTVKDEISTYGLIDYSN